MNGEPSGDAPEYEAPSITKIDPGIAPAEGDYLLAGVALNASGEDAMAGLRKIDP
jgi:hypothetical protein